MQGGNSRDPLNLGSLADERVNRALNEHTPESSPVPTPKHRKEKIEVVIPPNICDPLNLMQDETERALISPNTVMKKKRSRNKKRIRTSSASEVLEAGPEEQLNVTATVELATSEEVAEESESAQPNPAEDSITEVAGNSREFKELKLKPEPIRHNRRVDDKIVSPVVPQPGARKRSGFFPRSISKDLTIKNQRQCTRGSTAGASQSKGAQNNQFQTKDAKKFQFGNYDRFVV